MSALAAMFAPPRVRHVPTRLIVAGREVTKSADIPPMPDAEAREEIKAKLRLNYVRQWQADHPERRREHARNSYQRRKDIPEVREKKRASVRKYQLANKEKRSESMRKWYEKNKDYHAKWREANREKVRKYSRDYEERKRDAKRNQEKREHEPVAQTLPAPKAKGNGKPRTAAHAGRVEALASV